MHVWLVVMCIPLQLLPFARWRSGGVKGLRCCVLGRKELGGRAGNVQATDGNSVESPNKPLDGPPGTGDLSPHVSRMASAVLGGNSGNGWLLGM
jgi:hypothetical protein